MSFPTDPATERAKETTTQHKVIKLGLTHDRKECQIGDTIDLTEAQRQALVERKFIDGPKKLDAADKK
ncbi:hypothetical protein RDV84_00175 [Lysobacter yananisis]|uniref:DUF7210 domain-containing protein n=1 Tax=Lysobacter yananisis TaxID=1003114 RepID=A0ABY9P8H8_9GAMM|nr:hypothetical protein [Lysobacter yananisis]WMT03306.1 hypothetical protein RDV84_00175 [Lysobacter yananisis]